MIMLLAALSAGIHGFSRGIALGRTAHPPGLSEGLLLGVFTSFTSFLTGQCVVWLFSAMESTALHPLALLFVLANVLFVFTRAEPSIHDKEKPIGSVLGAILSLPMDVVFLSGALAMIGFPSIPSAITMGAATAALFMLGALLGRMGMRLLHGVLQCIQIILLLLVCLFVAAHAIG